MNKLVGMAAVAVFAASPLLASADGDVAGGFTSTQTAVNVATAAAVAGSVGVVAVVGAVVAGSGAGGTSGTSGTSSTSGH